MADKYRIEKAFKYSPDGISVEEKKVGDPDFAPKAGLVDGLVKGGYISKPVTKKDNPKMSGKPVENKAMGAAKENKAK